MHSDLFWCAHYSSPSEDNIGSLLKLFIFEIIIDLMEVAKMERGLM